MVGVTKRRVQAGQRGDAEGASTKGTRLNESTVEVHRKLYRHFNDTTFLQQQWRGSLVRVSLALSAVLAYRLYRLRDEQQQQTNDTSSELLPLDGSSSGSGSLLAFLLEHTVEITGVALGLLVAHFIRAAAPAVLAPRSADLPQTDAAAAAAKARKAWVPPGYPWSFHACLALTLLELLAFARVAARPGYVFHIDATLPVGAIYFLFVWRSDVAMRRSLDDAKMGLEASQRLVRTVGGTGGGGDGGGDGRVKAE